MALQSNTSIFIGGNEIIAFKRIMLHQQIDSHHMLELTCRMDVLEDLSQALGESSKNYLGEIISLQISALDDFASYETLEFKGIVTQVKTVKGYESNTGDSIVIKAQSPTFIADDGSNYASHNDVSLSEILDKTFKNYDSSKLELLTQPNNNTPLHYSVQHNESAYDYASRLAAQYGEWFYYNGTQLVFGTPDTEELELNYGQDLKEYQLNLLPQSHNYKYFTNDYLLDEVHEKDAKEITAGASGYSGFVSNKANTIYSKETKVWHNLYNDPKEKQRFDAGVELQKKAIEIQQVQISGVSDNPGVKLGSIVKIEGGSYRITTITHTNNENGNYQNRFEGVTAEFDAYPNTNIHAYPKSETQTAVVMENADPDGLGRVKVQFHWQKAEGEMTPWIRMVTPHAGGDKGFHFVPETGEEVLVGFEGGNAEQPYMMGSLYNGSGKAEAFKNEKNDIKAIKTRSGHTLSFSDEEGKGSITISDSSGNTITLDTAKSEITINAPKKMTFTSEEIEIKASKKVLIDGTNNVDITSKEIVADGSTKTTLKSASQVNVEGSNTNVKGTAKLKMEGAVTDIDGTTTTNVKGGMLNLN